MTREVKTYDERIEELKRRAEAAHDREAVKLCTEETRRQIILGRYLETGIAVNGTVNDIKKSKTFDLFLMLDVDRKLFGLAVLTKEERERRKVDSKKRKKEREKKEKQNAQNEQITQGKLDDKIENNNH
jgi:hypothetical protein